MNDKVYERMSELRDLLHQVSDFIAQPFWQDMYSYGEDQINVRQEESFNAPFESVDDTYKMQLSIGEACGISNMLKYPELMKELWTQEYEHLKNSLNPEQNDEYKAP